MNILQEWEYNLVPGPNLFAAHRYFAGTTEQRTSDLHWAMTDPDIDAVIVSHDHYDHLDYPSIIRLMAACCPLLRALGIGRPSNALGRG